MNYQEYTPSKALQAFVDVIWVLDAPASGTTERVLPDGRTEFVVHFGNAFEISYDGHSYEPQGNVIFAAQIENNIYLRATGRAAMIGARFKAHLATCFFCFSMEDIAGKVHNVINIPGLEVDELHSQISASPSDVNRVTILEKFLAS
jgi:hypothetical protein